MPTISGYHRPENEKYLYRHAQSEGWNVVISFFGNGPDVAPSHKITAYYSDSYYAGDSERSKSAARRFRNMACRELGLPIPRLTDRFRKHAPPHWQVAQHGGLPTATRQRRAGNSRRGQRA